MGLFREREGNNSGGDGMYSYFYLWAVWILWVMVAFYLPKSVFRTISFVSVLLLLISFRYNHLFAVELPFLILMIYSFILLWIFRISWRKYIQLILLSLLYATYMLWALLSPIFDILTFFIIGIAIGFLYLQYIGESLIEKLIIWNIGLLIGHFIYSVVLNYYGLGLNRNDLYFWNLHTAVLLLLAMHSLWLKGLEAIEQLERNLNRKKEV